MLAILDYTRSRIGTITDYEDLEITHELENGDKTISFRYLGTDIIPIEYYVQTDTDRFTIKEVAPDESGSEYHGQLDLEDLQRVPFKRFTSKGQTLTAAAEAALDGTGWTVQTSISTLRNVQRYKVTALEALYAIRDAWMCEISFDNLNKVVTFAETIGEDKGVYFMRGINLKDVSPNYDSYDYVTRLIPYGADGLTIESVNNGIAYVENYQYSTKILTLIWEDTSYEDAQALKEDATKKLADLSKPKKSFSCDVINLAKESSTYSILDYSIGDTIHLVDDLTGTNELQRIVKLVEHPDEPEEDTCEISNTVLTFEELQDRMQKAADAWEEISNTDGTVNGVYVHGVEIDNIVGIEVLVGDGVTTNGAVANVAVLYAQGDSPTEAPTSGWDTTAPEWDSGKYMWQKTVTTYVNGETEETAETNITGAQGDAGFSPEVTITKEEDKTTISITDATGTKTATIEDGKFIWNLLKEKDIPAVSFTNKGITYEYEGNGWWYIHGTVTGNDVGAVTLYGVDSTGNLITSNSDICVCVEKNTSPLIDDKSRIQIRYAENSSAQTMSDAYISESWSGMKVSVDANGVMHFGSGDVTVDANGIMSFPEMFTDVDQDGVLQFMTYDDRIILNHTHNNGYRVAAIRHYLSADATGTVISGRIRIMLVNGSTVNGWTPNESDVAPVTVMLTNSNHTFAGGASAALGGSVDCAVVAHKGAVPCPAHVGTITGCPTGMSTSISGNDTIAATITITVTTSMATADGTLTVPVTVENQLFNLIFSYSIAKKGKGSQVFHQSTAPSSSLGLEMGDTWFDTAHDYEIYTWNGTDWVPEPLGADAISAGAIVASHIAAGAITTDKISANGISAGVITAGILLSEDESTYFDLENDKIVTGNTSGEYTEISNGSVKFKNSNVQSEFTYKVDGNRRGLNIDSDDPIYFGPFLDPALIYNPVIDDTIETYTLEAMRGIATHQGLEIFNDVSDTPYIDFHITHSGTVLDYDYRMRMNPGYPDILSFVSPSGATLRVEKEVYTENCMSVRTTPNSGQKPRFDFFYQRYANSNRNNQSAYIEENSAGELIAHNTIANASDEVLKKDIVPLNGKFMDLVDKLQPKEYRFRQGDDNLKIGFVAQDVIRSMDDLGIIDQPIVVGSGCGEDYYGLDYSQIITILVAYCQDLRREINALKSGEN